MAGFKPVTSYDIDVTDTSAATEVTNGAHVLCTNWGSNPVFVWFGGATATADDTDLAIPAGVQTVLMRPDGSTHIAAVCASGLTSTLNVVTGYWQN